MAPLLLPVPRNVKYNLNVKKLKKYNPEKGKIPGTRNPREPPRIQKGKLKRGKIRKCS